MQEAQIRGLARRFRRALQEQAPLWRDVSFEHFPRGCCGDTALLLGRFLCDHGAGDVQYVLGTRRLGDSWSSHAWLVVDGLIVDITADQFDDVDEEVIVAATSPWHALTFQLDGVRRPGDYRQYDGGQGDARLHHLYALVLASEQATRET
jgi:hypothetical protein